MKITARHILIFLLLVMLSRIAWYDLRVIYSRLGSENNVGLFFLIQASVAIPAFALALLFPLKRFLNSWVFPVFAILILHTIITGVYFGNSTILIIQELFKYLLIPITFILTVSINKKYKSMDIIRIAALIVVTMMVLRLFIFTIISGGTIFIYGTPQDLFPLCAFLAIAINSEFFKRMTQSVFCFGIYALGEKRTVIVLAVSCFIIFGIETLRQSKRTLHFVMLTPFVIISIILLVQYTSNYGENRLGNQNIQHELSENSRRIAEVITVREKFAEAPAMVLTGFGGGAVLSLSSDTRTKVFEDLHSLHNTPAALIFRHGIIGLGVYLYLVFAGTGWLLRNLRSGRHHAMCATLLVYKFCTVIASFVIFGLIDDVLIGMAMGLIARQKKLDKEA